MAAASALGIGTVIAVAGVTPAVADEQLQIVLDPTASSVEYGETWYFSAAISVANPSSTGAFFQPDGTVVGRVSVSGQEDPYTIAPISPPAPADTSYNTAVSYVYSNGERPPLDAGQYDVTMSIDFTTYQHISGTSEPAQLTVAPAALTTSVRAVPDPGNPDNIVVTASLAGDFVTRLNGWDEAVSVAKLPAGTWHLTLTAADGTVALDRSIDQPAGIQPAVTTYWTDAVPGVAYTADASFTPVAESAGNFDIAAPSAFPFTASAPHRPVPTSTAAAAPEPPGESDGGATVPLWSIIGAGLIALGLLVTAIVLALRLRGPRAASGASTETEAPDVP